MEKIVVDKNICIGCGFCAASNPDVFEFDDEGQAYSIEDKNILDHASNEEKEELIDIKEGCPVSAIKIEKVGE